MQLNPIDLVEGETYVLKFDFIQSPTVRHNFGTEVTYLGEIDKNGDKVTVKIKGSTSEGFKIPISFLKQKD